MKKFNTVSEIKKHLRNEQKNGKTIGFVPTMGYLHEGHLSLLRIAKEENDCVVLSIFVNPTQFAPNEDYNQYPRDIEKDLSLAKDVSVDCVFIPNNNEIYTNDFQTYVEVKDMTQALCGISRPTHFRGVTTIVMKLFNIVRPDNAYFGQKDAQQSLVIKRMVKELNMDVKINVCPIVRESDGLAMSSRNKYLSKEQRSQAIILNQSLKKAKVLIQSGERNSKTIYDLIYKMIKSQNTASIDYISIVDENTLKDVDIINKNVLIALAIKFGNTRLIDNVIVEV